MHKDFIIGETKFVELEVASRDGSEFTITSATWTLESMGEEVDHGTAIIDGHKVSVLLTAPEIAGRYTLIIWYNIPPEVIGAKVVVNVE